MSAATSSGTPDRPVVTAPIAPAVLAAMAARVGESMPVGNEGGGVVVAAGSSPEAQALLGRTVGVLGGSTYSRVPMRPRVAGPGPARRRDIRTRRGVLRQPAHRARHGRHDAARGTHGVGPHRGRLQPRPDAQPAVSRRLDRARQHRAPRRAGAAPARPGRGARLQLVGGGLPRRPHRRARRRPVPPSRSTPSAADELASQILTAMERAANARATEYSRYGSTTHKQVYIYGGLDRGPDRTQPELRHGVGRRRLAPHALHDQCRGGRGRTDARPGGSGDHHHVRQRLHRSASISPRRSTSTRSASTGSRRPGRST